MNTLIIGDIHGCFEELLELLDRAAIGQDDVVVSVGDVVDRGPDPGAVIDFFRARPNAVVLMGNHERKHVRNVLSYSQQVTAQQLGGRYADDVAWMAGLPYHFERDDVRVVHYGLYPGVPLDEVPEDVRAGTTSGDARLRERFGGRPGTTSTRTTNRSPSATPSSVRSRSSCATASSASTRARATAWR
jgi:serine/threonine protein phosphatase 1